MRRAAGRIVKKLRLHGHEAYFAGGWVRDLLLHRKSADIDIATSALPKEVLRLFPGSRAIGAQFGVIQVLMSGHEFEVATFRRDHDYIDGRHPEKVTFSGPEEDASRRDFTINGLYYDPVENRLIDYVHGRNDIRNKLIRTIGDPYKRLSEDKLRMLRAIRFSCNLSFKIVPETWIVIKNLSSEILKVSGERIRDELIKILTGPDPGAGLELLERSGLMQHILPEIASLSQIPEPAESGISLLMHSCNTVAQLHRPSTVLALGALLHHVGSSPNTGSALPGEKIAPGILGKGVREQVCRRLKMSNAEIHQILDLASLNEVFLNPAGMKKSTRTRLLRKSNIDAHLELLRAHLRSSQEALGPYRHWVRLLKEYRQSPARPPLINGDDLIKLGYAPGPLFKEILRSVEELQYEGVLNSRAEALHHIRAHYSHK